MYNWKKGEHMKELPDKLPFSSPDTFVYIGWTMTIVGLIILFSLFLPNIIKAYKKWHHRY